MRLLHSVDQPNCAEFACFLIVTGSDVRAETMDRPLAYRLRDAIRERLDGQSADIVVVSDFRYLHDFANTEIPTISIGGPGVNAVCQKWLEELPVVMTVDDEFWIQTDVEEVEVPRASVWGVNHETTCTALETFLDRFLEAYLCQSVGVSAV